MPVLSGADRCSSMCKKPVFNLENAGLKTTRLLRTFDLLIYIANSEEGLLQYAFKKCMLNLFDQ